jgi:hypothetical protein
LGRGDVDVEGFIDESKLLIKGKRRGEYADRSSLSLSELRLCVIQRAIHHHPSSIDRKVAKVACSHIQQEYHAYRSHDQECKPHSSSVRRSFYLWTVVKTVIRDRNTHIDCACSAIKRGYSVSQHPAFKPRPVHEGFHEGPCLRPGTPPSKMVGADGTTIATNASARSICRYMLVIVQCIMTA